MTIKLYNMHGQMVKEVLTGDFSGGFHSVPMPKGLAAGVYSVELTVNNQSLFQKMISY